MSEVMVVLHVWGIFQIMLKGSADNKIESQHYYCDSYPRQGMPGGVLLLICIAQ